MSAWFPRVCTFALLDGRWHKMQHRLNDARRRSSISYSIACFFGRGPILQSDTARETTLKKIPAWAQKTALDIIKERHLNQRQYATRQYATWQVGTLFTAH